MVCGPALTCDGSAGATLVLLVFSEGAGAGFSTDLTESALTERRGCVCVATSGDRPTHAAAGPPLRGDHVCAEGGCETLH